MHVVPLPLKHTRTCFTGIADDLIALHTSVLQESNLVETLCMGGVIHSTSGNSVHPVEPHSVTALTVLATISRPQPLALWRRA